MVKIPIVKIVTIREIIEIILLEIIVLINAIKIKIIVAILP
jgi:hypothetical protein